MSSAGRSARRKQGGLGHVLLLNQSWEAQATIETGLETEGFQTTAGGTSVELLDRLARSEPDIVIIGTALADTDTRTLCALIRARSGVPVIALVEKGSVDAVELLDLGADVTMVEPVSPFELLARVRALLRRTPPRSSSGEQVLAFGDMKLDRSSGVLSMATGSVHLEGREFTLMETLMLGGERVTSRRRLQAVLAVEGADLDGQVRRLRQRVEAIEGWRRIVSEHGLGFRLLEHDLEPELP
ncbi:MAG: response regulator transcription factor [Actinobacteria bacterium]|nr:response regulator transcription factor [Actinomycetota bacterium]